jgi:hypothetical protein
MGRKSVAVVALGLFLTALGACQGPWGPMSPWITGNDTGGIIPYSPAIEGNYRELATAWCARWQRLSHVTSVDRQYGGYVAFVCMDRPGVIH